MLRYDFEICTEMCNRQARSNFRYKIKKSLGDNADFVQSLNPQEYLLVFPAKSAGIAVQHLKEMAEDMSSSEDESTQAPEDKNIELLSLLFHFSMKIKADIKSTPGHTYIGGINSYNTENVVPESLYLFLRLLCSGDDILDEDSVAADCRIEILSVAQDIVFLASGGRKHTPKHLGLGLTVHQATRSKEFVQLIHSAGHSISYEAIRSAGTALANSVLLRYAEQGNTIIPMNFVNAQFQGYIRMLMIILTL